MTHDPLFQRAIRSLCQSLAAEQIAISDAELLARFRDHRDAGAFEEIVRRHGPGVLSASRKVLSDDADVEDVFQAAFLVLLRDARAIRKGQSVGAWLYGVAHRLALKARAARRRRTQIESRGSMRGRLPAGPLVAGRRVPYCMRNWIGCPISTGIR